ncbi:23S rRNA pseudouridine955/2504/2580 synthase [Rhizomicrobium palustre]|uniref:Pseudouridine synthase n=1 Tax=Rhizomicrobium palustre TaxID=189966 RepID=A0A846N3R8_9PROT|nr:RluA family pseudouridine synthase [Rhizomicrobium palustre]NIK90253.1 23S rRNA pseudouridine955/2504/2580 synthase [Rhizomicrobium palustre]
MDRQHRISRDDNGIRLDRWFKRHFPALTHGRLEKLLRTGQIRLDGSRVKGSDRLSEGQMLRLPPLVTEGDLTEKPRSPEAVMKGSLEDYVLHMDSSVIVINKPSGLATQGGSGLTKHVDGMLDSLMFEKKQRPRLVHRLDRDTSGVLVIARTVPAAAALAKSLADRDASKIYWALTKGVPEKKKGTVKAALVKEGGFGPHGKDEKMTVRDGEDSKHAMTDYMVMGEAGEEFAFVAAKPVTGRTHQIRVHMAFLGTPIVGDFKYGGAEVKGTGAIADRLHLHARSIDIAHPDGGRLQVTAPLPPHMRASFETLGFDPDQEPKAFSFKKAPRKEDGEKKKKFFPRPDGKKGDPKVFGKFKKDAPKKAPGKKKTVGAQKPRSKKR